ncbi:PGAP1-like protein [Antricoccus suffuscus]|uniref:PGAP1-like protein n=1 Tax=Antricoccus suffuscus TaxID=1629062 RepID=A0A2T1A2D8_9ACTN|nr:alpha/beta fold hydrolase [Antricoccus suffuscus]PRZ42769.1 PGAP1-like protein [Antricoccus suffuscus]
MSITSNSSSRDTAPIDAGRTKLPIVYLRGFAGTTDGIDTTTNDPFYGFNTGTTHVRIDGDGDPAYYQFEGPLIRLLVEEGYKLLVNGGQRQLLDQRKGLLDGGSVWIDRFYDVAATTFAPAPKESLFQRIEDKLHHMVSADGFHIEAAATDLYNMILEILDRTGQPKVILVAHSMGGLVARCMMQKICQTADGKTPRRPAREIVDKLFTYGTPHGGIETALLGVNAAMEIFGPAGSDMFSPPKMYGYLTPGASFGDDPPRDEPWDPRRVPDDVFDLNKIFCIVGTDPKDYGPARLAIGPQSDGLVRIKNAYVKGAHRAYIYKSHSGPYGEVNSEEGYQNLRRFLFGRWAVSLSFADLTRDLPDDGTTWQADMRLSIRGLAIVISEQAAARWCPIILNKVAAAATNPAPDADVKHDRADAPIPIVSTFLIPPTATDTTDPAIVSGNLSRYVVTLNVHSVVTDRGAFDFSNHLEQVGDWQDSLIVDVGGSELAAEAWYEWNSQVIGAISSVPKMPKKLDLRPTTDGVHVGTVQLPDSARALPIFAKGASLRITVADRLSDANQTPG